MSCGCKKRCVIKCTKRYVPTAEALDEAFKQGYHQGFNDGVDVGHEEGFYEGLEQGAVKGCKSTKQKVLDCVGCIDCC